MFQGPEIDSSKPSSRVLKPPGGGTSNLFSTPEEVCSSNRTHMMASNIFGAIDEPQNVPMRANPPGGKESGIFEGHKPNAFRHLTNPPGGKASNIFGSPQPISIVRAHPNKPKDHVVLHDGGNVPKEPVQKAAEEQKPQMEETRGREPQKITKEPESKISDHEPRLGPRPRSHNKVLNPPGGKSSLAFY